MLVTRDRGGETISPPEILTRPGATGSPWTLSRSARQPSGQHLFLYCASPVPKEDEETTVSQLFAVGEGEGGQGAIRPSLPAFNLRIVHELSRMLE